MKAPDLKKPIGAWPWCEAIQKAASANQKKHGNQSQPLQPLSQKPQKSERISDRPFVVGKGKIPETSCDA